MRIRPSVACFVVIAAVLTVLVIWLGGKRFETPMAPPEQTNAVTAAENTTIPLRQPNR
jgi:hypothetical protein